MVMELELLDLGGSCPSYPLQGAETARSKLVYPITLLLLHKYKFYLKLFAVLCVFYIYFSTYFLGDKIKNYFNFCL